MASRVGEYIEELERQTACTPRMLGGEFGHVVDGIVDYYPEIVGDIVFGYLLDRNDPCHRCELLGVQNL